MVFPEDEHRIGLLGDRQPGPAGCLWRQSAPGSRPWCRRRCRRRRRQRRVRKPPTLEASVRQALAACPDAALPTPCGISFDTGLGGAYLTPKAPCRAARLPDRKSLEPCGLTADENRRFNGSRLCPLRRRRYSVLFDHPLPPPFTRPPAWVGCMWINALLQSATRPQAHRHGRPSSARVWLRLVNAPCAGNKAVDDPLLGFLRGHLRCRHRRDASAVCDEPPG